MNSTLNGCLLAIGSLAAFIARPGFAQEAPNSQPATQPSAQIVAASGSVVEPTTQPGNGLLTFNFRNAQIDAVLDFLSAEAGFTVIKIHPATGTVTMFTRTPVTPEQAVVYLNSALKSDGLTAIQMGKLLKITTLDDAKKADIPVRFGDDPTKIADTDELITQIIPVRSVDAVKLKTDLQPLVSTDADLTANAASNSLMITDTSANIRRVVEIVSSLDKRETDASDIRIKQLKYADATAAAKLIMDIFNPQTQQNAQQNNPFANNPFFRLAGGGGAGGGGAGGGGRGGGGFGGFGGFGGGGPGGAPGGGASASGDSGNTGHVQASADERTNTIVVSGPPDTLAIIDGVLNQLDSDPAEDQDFFIYRVKNGQAVDMASTLNGLFSGTTATSNTANRSQFATGTGNRIAGTGGFGSSGGGGLTGGGGGFGGGGGGGFGNTSFGTSNRNTATATGGGLAGRATVAGTNGGAQGALGSAAEAGGVSELIGQVYVVADQDTNSLLVATATKYETRVKGIIDQLDSRVQQVLIKVLIAEVTHDNSLDFGTDFSILDINRDYTGKGQNFGSTLGAAAAAASTAQPAGFVVSVLERNINVTLQALAQQNKLDVLSRPYILTSDNQEADITVGSEVPFITDTYVDSNGGVHNSTTYEDIGIILTVTPHINPEGLVTMLVSPQVSALTSQTVTISAGVSLPVIEQRQADSYLTVRDGQTVVIGGMMQDQKNQSISRIPVLGEIPIIGRILFSYSTTSKTKTELLIFLTPHVAADPDFLKPMGEQETRALKLVPGAVERGVFQDQMRGLQRGSATQPSDGYIPPPVSQPHSFFEPLSPGSR